MRYGVLGVGEIAEAIVTGLCAGDPPEILLSPRNRERSAALAERHASVSVAADNQAVVDEADVVVLSIRPQDARAVLGPLRFRAGQAVVSVMARVSIAELGELGAGDVARAIPLPPVARREGVTAVHPGTAAARELFDPLGGALVVEDEAAFNAMSVATGALAAQLEYQATVAAWLAAQGVPEASRYVASIFAGVEGDPRSYATPGGLNERFAALLRDGGAFDLVTRSLDELRQPPA